MSMKLSSLTIFFPAYNEEQNIAGSIKEALQAGYAVADTLEILIVNDGSADNTSAIVHELSQKHPEVHLINHPHNLGYGAALMTGFKNAHHDWVFFTDADLQFDLAQISLLAAEAPTSDVIIGYRKKRNDPFMRLMNAKGWNLLNRLLFGLKVTDIDCAFKLFKREALEKVINDMTSGGAMISAELLVRLQKEGYAFTEVGVDHFPRTAGSPTGAKPSVILRAFKELATVYRGDLGPDWAGKVNRFIVIGVANTIIDILGYVLLSRFVPVLYLRPMWAKGISYIISMLHSFTWNALLDSIARTITPRYVLRFALFGTAALAINTVSMFVFYTAIGLDEWPSVAGATIVSFTWNYLASKVLISR